MLTGNYFREYSPDKEVLIDAITGSKVTLSELKEKTAKVRNYLRHCGFGKKEKAFVLLRNSIDYAVTLLALFDTDITIIPVNPRINEFKFNYLLKHSGARFLITSNEILNTNTWLNHSRCKTITTEKIFEAQPARPGDLSGFDPAFSGGDETKLILYTSGTTGSPKGVMLSKDAVQNKIEGLVDLLHFNQSDAYFSFLPYSSGHGMIPGLLVPLLSGCKVYTTEFNPFIAPVFWELIEKYGINYFTSVPSILALLKDYSNVPKEKPAALKSIFSASDNLPVGLIEWYRNALGLTIRNCYGLTETASWAAVTADNDPLKGKANYAGKAFNAEIASFDSGGKRLPAGAKGELKVKSACNMQGYYNNKAETDAAFSGGFINTGDCGYVDSEGRVFILGRKKHIIIRNGINIYPPEVDQAFLEHPDVAECASFGIADKKYGEKLIVALAARSTQYTINDYLEFAGQKLPVYLLPDDIVIMDSLPKGETGKIVIDEIRKKYIITLK